MCYFSLVSKFQIQQDAVEPRFFMSPIQLEVKHMECLANIEEDSEFIYYLLDALYDKEELLEGFYGGGKSNFNGLGHEQLNPAKMAFIKRSFNLFLTKSFQFKSKKSILKAYSVLT